MKLENCVLGLAYLGKHFPGLKYNANALHLELGDMPDEIFKAALMSIVRTERAINRTENLCAVILQHASPTITWAEALESIMSEIRRVGAEGLKYGEHPKFRHKAIYRLIETFGWSHLCNTLGDPTVVAQARDAFNQLVDVEESKQYRELTAGEVKKLPGGVGALIEKVAGRRVLSERR